jgi:hypothetical protein
MAEAIASAPSGGAATEEEEGSATLSFLAVMLAALLVLPARMTTPVWEGVLGSSSPATLMRS